MKKLLFDKHVCEITQWLLYVAMLTDPGAVPDEAVPVILSVVSSDERKQ